MSTLDTQYFRQKMTLINRGLCCYTPQELAREFVRLAKVADEAEAVKEAALPKQTDAVPVAPTGDQLRALVRKASTSASDGASPQELVLAGWNAALAQRVVSEKPYAYEYGKDNGDGTYSVVIDRGDMVQIGPREFGYAAPANAIKDRPVTPLYTTPPAAPVALTPMGEEGNEWYFDCDGHYIDVKRDENSKYSVFFRNRADGTEAWHDQADVTSPVATSDAHARVTAYLDRRAKAVSIDAESIHAFDLGPDFGTELLVSDLRVILAAATSKEPK